jgi:hypothetical protein
MHFEGVVFPDRSSFSSKLFLFGVAVFGSTAQNRAASSAHSQDYAALRVASDIDVGL